MSSVSSAVAGTDKLLQLHCELCGDPIRYEGRGHRPKFCGQPHRQAAYEDRRRRKGRRGGCRHGGMTQRLLNQQEWLRGVPTGGYGPRVQWAVPAVGGIKWPGPTADVPPAASDERDSSRSSADESRSGSPTDGMRQSTSTDGTAA